MIALTKTIFGLLIGGVVARLFGLLARFHSAERNTIARRSFIRNAALGSVLIILGQLGAGFVRFIWPNKTGAFGKEIIVPGTDVPAIDGEPYRDTAGKFYLVHTQDGLVALYWKCPHLGCTVPWVASETQFHCPCHGSIYSYDGTLIGGPAPRSMDYMAVSLGAAGDVIVDTGDIRTRLVYEPEQAVKY